MAVDEISGKIGDAWGLHDKGDNVEAAKAFEAISSLSSLDTPAQIDALYGHGLAKRAAGDRVSAKVSFERAYKLTESALAELRAGRSSNDLSTTKDDRYMMLIRMIQQRIDEVSL